MILIYCKECCVRQAAHLLFCGILCCKIVLYFWPQKSREKKHILTMNHFQPHWTLMIRKCLCPTTAHCCHANWLRLFSTIWRQPSPLSFIIDSLSLSLSLSLTYTHAHTHTHAHILFIYKLRRLDPSTYLPYYNITIVSHLKKFPSMYIEYAFIIMWLL